MAVGCKASGHRFLTGLRGMFVPLADCLAVVFSGLLVGVTSLGQFRRYSSAVARLAYNIEAA